MQCRPQQEAREKANLVRADECLCTEAQKNSVAGIRDALLLEEQEQEQELRWAKQMHRCCTSQKQTRPCCCWMSGGASALWSSWSYRSIR